jgi:hypothetical protein
MENQENIFKIANNIMSERNEKDFRRDGEIETPNRLNSSKTSSKEIMDKILKKYPSKNAPTMFVSKSSSGTCDKEGNEDTGKDDELFLFCDGDDQEKNKDRLLTFDAKNYELVTADERFDDTDDYEDGNSELYESSPSTKGSPFNSEIHSNSKPQVAPGFKHRRDLLRPHNASPTLSFKSGTLSSGQMSPASFIQTGAPPNTMIDSCLGGKEEPIKQTLLKALSGLNN